MSRKTHKIGKVVSLASAEERRFGMQTGQSQNTLNQQLDRLGELNSFRRNYATKNPGTSSVSSVRWKDYQNFLQRLDHAVVSQQQIIKECERNLEVHRKRWMVKRQKLESLERVLEKSQKLDQAYESRLEQKQLDDIPNLGHSLLTREGD